MANKGEVQARRSAPEPHLQTLWGGGRLCCAGVPGEAEWKISDGWVEMELDELADLIQTRRSIRRWQEREVPDELIRRALEIATWAPNGGNRQNWQFVVVKDRQLINRLADAVQAKSDLIVSWPEAEQFREAATRWQRTSAFFRRAPVCIAALMGKYQSTADLILAARGASDPAALEMIAARERGASRLQSVAAAISYLLLVFHQMGLGACWMAGPQQAKREIETLLEAPADMDFVALIPVGYPAEEPRSEGRRPLDEVVRFY